MTAPGTTSSEAKRAGIAILGGSFDPPHRTHLRLANQALEHLPVSEVRVIPAGDHPHKQDRGMTPGTHRLAMCRLAFGDRPGITIDDRELRRTGLSFTVDTLAELTAEFPDRPMFFLIGSDNLPLLPTWREHHRLMQLATVVTYPRQGHPVAEAALSNLDLSADERRSLLGNVLPLAADDIAATVIRANLGRGGRDLADLDPAVLRYATEHDLYAAR